jgi:NADPH-dependent ferric siderophore reductase
VVSHSEAEQTYFDDVMFPGGTSLERIVCNTIEQGLHVRKELEKITDFDAVWGAMEASSSKQVRHYVRNERKLKSSHNLVKPYWRLED